MCSAIILTGLRIINWNDYDKRGYTGKITVATSDWFDSKHHKNNLSYSLASNRGYDLMVRDLSYFNQNMMDSVVSMYDSIKTTLKPSPTEFAKIIVSSIQSIPYTLILQNECKANLYPSGSFTRNYLGEGKPCVGSVRYGIYTQLEFVATLDGDCDTRSLLLYTLLKKYNYNVAMMISETLQHAIIAVELSGVDGRYFTIEGKRYYLWETTENGIPPGVFPKEQSNPNLWKISLI